MKNLIVVLFLVLGLSSCKMDGVGNSQGGEGDSDSRNIGGLRGSHYNNLVYTFDETSNGLKGFILMGGDKDTKMLSYSFLQNGMTYGETAFDSFVIETASIASDGLKDNVQTFLGADLANDYSYLVDKMPTSEYLTVIMIKDLQATAREGARFQYKFNLRSGQEIPESIFFDDWSLLEDIESSFRLR